MVVSYLFLQVSIETPTFLDPQQSVTQIKVMGLMLKVTDLNFNSRLSSSLAPLIMNIT